MTVGDMGKEGHIVSEIQVVWLREKGPLHSVLESSFVAIVTQSTPKRNSMGDKMHP